MRLWMRYDAGDYGTERALTLVDASGRTVAGPVDPFWPGGMPADPRRRRAALRDAARKLAKGVRDARD